MAYLDDLIARVGDPALRRLLTEEATRLRSRTSFGIVFERHIPERVALRDREPRPGARIVLRMDQDGAEFVLESLEGDIARLKASDNQVFSAALSDLLVLHDLGEPIYPSLAIRGEIERAPGEPYHVVIEGENYYALQLLTFLRPGSVDCIYIDPPYNTGVRDWKYNNRFVDSDDAYRHSKWLAFMERRLRLAKTLMNPEASALICAIDEKEYLRLGLLLDQLFPQATIQMVTSVVKPEGTGRSNEFSRTNEFLFFVMVGRIAIEPGQDNMFDRDGSEASEEVEWRNLRRRERSSKRGSRPNQFYAVFVDVSTGRIQSVGEPLADDVTRDSVHPPAGTRAVFPLTPRGDEMIWGVVPETLRSMVQQGYARSNGETIQFLNSGVINAIVSGSAKVVGRDNQGAVVAIYEGDSKRLMPKTVWVRDSHNTQVHGTVLLKRLLPGRDFPSPKSVYAVADAMRFFVRNKKRAVILDFFGGSGTTLHATCLLNDEDGGARQCLLLTNNEVDAATAAALKSRGIYPGDVAYEEAGIFEAITRPRVEAVITGRRPDGERVEGGYISGKPMSNGFSANARFFSLRYLDRDRVELGEEYEAIAPALWIKAGAQGPWELHPDDDAEWSIPDRGTYAVLFDETKVGQFRDALEARPAVRQVYIVTDSQEAYAELCERLGTRWPTSMLYRDYLRNFRVDPGQLT